MRRVTPLVVIPLFAALACSCSGERAAQQQREDPEATAGMPDAAAATGVGTPEALEEPAVPETPTVGGDGSRIELLAVSAAQLETVDLPGELACTFEAPTHGTLLVARADVLPDGEVRAVLSNNGFTEMLANGEAGGFNDLLDGVTLGGKGLTVGIARGVDQPTGDETTRHAATLTVQREDGAARTYEGTWTCGP